MSGSTVVVIGASAGGMDALTRLAAQLPGDFPAPIFVVHHMAADTTGAALVQAINKSGSLVCTEAGRSSREATSIWHQQTTTCC